MFTCIKIRKYLNAQTFIIYLHLLVPGKCISLLALKWDETIKHTHRPGSSTGYTSLKPHLSTWKGVFYFYPATKIPAGALMKSVRPCNEIAMFSCVFYYQKSMCSTVMVDFLASQFQLQGCWVKTSPPSANPETCEKSHGDQSAIFLFKRYQVVHRRKESSKDGSWSFKTCSLVKDYN